MKKINKILIVGVAALSLVGCGKIPTLKNGEEAVVTSKPGNISANQLYEKIKDDYGFNVLMEMIDTVIFDDMYDETSEEKDFIKDQIKQLKDSAAANGMEYKDLLNYYGVTENQLKDNMRLTYRRNLAVTDYLKKELKEDEVKDYYNKNIYGDINVKHILIAPDVLDGMTAKEKEAAEKKALKEAKEVISKLDKGEKWSDLVKKYSDDSKTAKEDGDLGWFNVGEMQKDFEDKAFALKKGKYTTTPAKTSFGYHIILKVDEKAKPKYKDTKDEIKDTIVKKNLQDNPNLTLFTLDKIRKEADMKIIDSKLKSQYNDHLVPKNN